MGKKYNEEFAPRVIDDFILRSSKDFKKAKYSIEIEPDFNDPPVLESLRLLSGIFEIQDNPELSHKITKYCIVGKMVKIYKDGTLINGGSFQLNSINDSFDAFQVFKDDPKALLKLIEMAVSFVMEKCTPEPEKGTAGIPAEKAK